MGDRAVGIRTLEFSCGLGRVLGFIHFDKVFSPGHILRSVESLSAFSAPVGAHREKQKNPKFEKPATLGAVHVVAAAQRANPLRLIQEQAQHSSHWDGMIAPSKFLRNDSAIQGTNTVRSRIKSMQVLASRGAAACRDAGSMHESGEGTTKPAGAG